MHVSLVCSAKLCYNKLSVGSYISVSERQTITTSTLENFIFLHVCVLIFILVEYVEGMWQNK